MNDTVPKGGVSVMRLAVLLAASLACVGIGFA